MSFCRIDTIQLFFKQLLWSAIVEYFSWQFVRACFKKEKVLDFFKNRFIPKRKSTNIPMPKLSKRYDEFVAIMGYEQVDLKAEMPAALRKLLGLE